MPHTAQKLAVKWTLNQVQGDGKGAGFRRFLPSRVREGLGEGEGRVGLGLVRGKFHAKARRFSRGRMPPKINHARLGLSDFNIFDCPLKNLRAFA